MTSPCSVTLIAPSSVPYGWARIASWVGPPPRPTVPPRPWNSRSRTPCAAATSRSARWARWIAHWLVVMPGLLVGVGVAEHHLLHVAAGRDERPVRRQRQQLVEQLAGRAQLGRPSPAAARSRCRATLGVHVDQPGLAGQHHGGEHVVDAEGHRDDVRLDDLGAEPVLRLADRGERRRTSRRAASVERRVRVRRAAGGRPARAASSSVRSLAAGRRSRRPRRPGRRAGRAPAWCASACSRTSSVARCRPNAETRADRRGPARPSAVSCAAVRAQRVAHQLQVGDQLARSRGSRGPARAASPRGQPLAGVARASPGCSVAFSRYGSSALSRRNRGATSGSASRSARGSRQVRRRARRAARSTTAR